LHLNLNEIKSRLNAYERLVRLDKPTGTLLLLWPTFWGLWMASGGWPRLDHLLIFFAGTVVMRSAGCAMNDYADRNIDAHVARTRERPLATGEISPREALAVAGGLAAAAFCMVLFLNVHAIALSFAGIAVAAAYPYSKRMFAMPQAVLGVAFSFGIPMAYAAVQARLPVDCFWLMAATFFWIVAYDTEYAMVDRADDVRIGVRSSAILFGRFDVAAIMSCYAAMLLLLAGLGWSLRLGWPYFAGIGVAGMIAIYHYRLIRGRDPHRALRAFRHNSWLGFAVFAGVMLAYPPASLRAFLTYPG
jgi:4-hydroxybenzoate polyprenyltransferase